MGQSDSSAADVTGREIQPRSSLLSKDVMPRREDYSRRDADWGLVIDD